MHETATQMHILGIHRWPKLTLKYIKSIISVAKVNLSVHETDGIRWIGDIINTVIC